MPGLRPRRRGADESSATDASGTSDPTLDASIQGDLDDLVAALDSLGQAECARLFAFWSGVDSDVRATAHDHAQVAAERTGRRAAIQAVQEELSAWGAAGRQRGKTGWGEQWVDPGPPEMSDGTRQAAVPALVDTATALALQDVLDDPDFDALFGPWLNAMGDGGASEETPPSPAGGE